MLTASPLQGTLFDTEDLAPPPRKDVARVKANLAALTLVRVLDGRAATPEETAVLAAWSGWGAVPGVFDPARPAWDWARSELRSLLTADEYKSARASTLNAHYTAPWIAAEMWRAVKMLGFTGGRVLEPGCGHGNFIATAPPGARITGVEIDPVTAAIAQARCPSARIVTGSFADVTIPGLFDLVIGNVPFGKFALHDPVHNAGGHSIHNHFIIKSLHLTRPGGLVAVLTSRYTLDAEHDTARREIHALADLAAAIRLPSAAHQEAGTKVVTDLLIFRRHDPGTEPEHPDWLATEPLAAGGRDFPVNARMHPRSGADWAVLGRFTAGHSMYGPDLIVEPTGNLDEQLRTAVNTATAWSLHHMTPGQTPDPDPGISAEGLEEGHILVAGRGFARAENGVVVPHPVPSTQARELTALLGLRDAALAVLRAEVATLDDTRELGVLRGKLRDAYDAYHARYGALNRTSQRRTGRTDPATGEELLARVRPPMGGFRADPHAPLVFALEDYDPESAVSAPAPILSRRVIVRRELPATAETPADALAICLDGHGRADIDIISKLLGTAPDDAREQMAELVFDDPESGLVPAAEYLSGDVRLKYAQAWRASRDDPRFEVNVAALREVIPSDLTPGEIDGRLGAVWISADYVQQFLREILDDQWLTVEHPGGQIWAVTAGKTYGVRSHVTWGTTRIAAAEIAQHLLEQRRIEIRDRVDKNHYVVNVEDTAAANEKAAEMAERFSEWLWEDPDRAVKLARIYNDRFNGIVLRSYDDAKLTLPGFSAAFALRPHQIAAVARIIAEPTVLLAHEVGAGKTAEMVVGAMELRRLGMVRKPAVVVPGHILDQFAGEWMRLYPLARILVVRKEDLQAEKRRRFVARVATGDWDAVIMSSSVFERIPLSAKALKAYLDREEAQFAAWLDVARDSRSRTVKRIEAAMLRARQRSRAKLDSRKDPGLTFEETGIDYLFVDEAHRYKNLRTPSAIADAGIDGSLRATDLDAKLCWLRERNGDRIATFATATPIANSITELHVVQRYLRPDLLDIRGLDVFDSWAATFGELVTEVELAPEGGGSFRLKTRFSKFRNVPELLRMFHLFADVKTGDDLSLPVPDLAEVDGRREVITVEVPMTDVLAGYVADLSDRAEKIRNRQVRPEEDNMLTVTGDGRKAALDLRLVGCAQDEPGKIAAAAPVIYQIWHDNRDRVYPGPGGVPSPVTGALQLVMADLGTPRDGWNAYDELRDQLVMLGMPPRMIRYIHDAKTDQAKAALFAACRSGNVAVLIGSTEKMGIGTNVQDRAIALHHLDAPWRPADIRQRDGRILRDGNCNPEVRIYRYVVSGSFDGYSWQILARKARFIAQVLRGRLDVREVDDIGDTALSYAQVKAIATGNPLLMEEAAAAAVLAKLERAARAHNRNQSLLTSTAAQQAHIAVRLREEAALAAAAEARRVDVSGDLFRMVVGGRVYLKRAEAGTALSDVVAAEYSRLLKHWAEPETQQAGELAGFPLFLRVYRGSGQVVSMWLGDVPGTRLDMGRADGRQGATVIKRLEYRLSKLADFAADALARAERCETEAAKARAEVGAVFPRAAELAAAVAEVARIRAALDALARAPQKAA
ncbi:MAG TPA: hypothetical protein VFQ44_02375 [Streptosporangiaceae bacterium]|nr:hypothetical protein [Streptosporangiaceae bacterium]